MAKMIKYRNQGHEAVAEVIANKGICWQIADGSFVPKKLVTSTWEESEEQDPPEPAHATLTDALKEITKSPEPSAASAPRAPKTVTPDTPAGDVITLKQLCFQLELEPRIARRRLRKGVGLIGTGGRWEWAKDSPELVTVHKLLAAAE